MPAILSPSPAPLGAAFPPRKQWTRAECDQLGTLGLPDFDQYELINGELVRKMGKNNPHVRALILLGEWLRSVFGLRQVAQGATMDVAAADNPTSAPEPDAIALAKSYWEIQGRPTPPDIHLVVEVSDSTLAFDITTKASLYARAEIADYWVLDVNGRRILVHREPAGGIYRSVVAYAEDEAVAPHAAPGCSIRAKDLLA